MSLKLGRVPPQSIDIKPQSFEESFNCIYLFG